MGEITPGEPILSLNRYISLDEPCFAQLHLQILENLQNICSLKKLCNVQSLGIRTFNSESASKNACLRHLSAF